jgi:predicted NBD/HSP70 family sugar kinase
MRTAIGLDIGGTKIVGVLADEEGRIIEKIRALTEADKDFETVMNNILDVINKLDDGNVSSIGIGLPGIINDDGLLFNCENIPALENFNVAKEIEKQTGKKVFQENDANCFALAEHNHGAGRGYQNVVGIIIGTGIGAGVIKNNYLIRGDDGAKGEFGKMKIISNHEESFEDLCSGPAIVKRYKEAGGAVEAVGAKTIFDAIDEVAFKIIDETYKFLVEGITYIIDSENPEIVVLGGGVSNQPLYDKLNEAIDRPVKVVKNELGDDSGVLGAVQLVFHS